MKNQIIKKYNRPVFFFGLSLLIPWVLWFSVAYLSNLLEQSSSLIFIQALLAILGLLAPTFVAAYLFLSDKELFSDLKKRFIRHKGFSPIYILLAFTLIFVSIIVAQLISLLFGHSIDQFYISGSPSFTSALLSPWFILLFAPVVEELAWHTYGTDALRQRFNLFTTCMIFSLYWAYDIIVNVINEKRPYYAYGDICSFLEEAPKHLPQYPQSRNELLFRLVNRFNPDLILEIGTGAGVSAGYLASVSNRSRVVTVDETHPDVPEVKKYLELFPNISYITGNIADIAGKILEGDNTPGFIHIAHTSLWRQTAERIIEFATPKMVVVVEDIKEKEKREWWRDIIKDERVGVTFRMNKLGILFL
jgi:membrane protease YdiL (CAAX protease family)